MNEWLAGLTLGEIISTLAVITACLAVILKFWRPFRKIFKGLETIGSDWNGAPERKDASGEVIEPARPGVMAQLETLRAQVQNSHSTNLRDDVDKALERLDVVTEVLAEHIGIAKQSDEQQKELAGKVDDLHERYGTKTGGTS
ncbi:conserved hypothetical protein [Arthrobacter sp. 9V]|uniref:hypothetical protein n=1 Tax=Arthrobacter sp. 9V TaxID=2653132 RepID=UPI0012F2D4F8|nr:hypothetical protein [Arthrobacter sp. 9V]VXB24447.1 conserved hypothetical protein [Arthrobacter sp. 9V]